MGFEGKCKLFVSIKNIVVNRESVAIDKGLTTNQKNEHIQNVLQAEKELRQFYREKDKKLVVCVLLHCGNGALCCRLFKVLLEENKSTAHTSQESVFALYLNFNPD